MDNISQSNQAFSATQALTNSNQVEQAKAQSGIPHFNTTTHPKVKTNRKESFAAVSRVKNYPNLQRGNTVNVGRHKGVREMVLAVTNDGKMIVEEFRKIAYDESNKMADRLEALSWLSDRGFGKAVNQVEISGRDGGAIQVEQASADDLRKELLGIGAIDVAGRIVAAKN